MSTEADQFYFSLLNSNTGRWPQDYLLFTVRLLDLVNAQNVLEKVSKHARKSFVCRKT